SAWTPQLREMYLHPCAGRRCAFGDCGVSGKESLRLQFWPIYRTLASSRNPRGGYRYRFPPSPTLLQPHVLVELGRSIRIREEYSMDARLLEYPAPVSGGRLVWQLRLRRRRYVCAQPTDQTSTAWSP